MDLVSGFREEGFLCAGAANSVCTTRAENRDWFSIVDDTNRALMRVADSAMNSARGAVFSPRAVAVRTVLRSCGALQGAILLAERGMIAESRTLVRSLLENAFCVTALVSKPVEFVKMLKEDSEASRRRQGKFILDRNLGKNISAENLRAAIDAIAKSDALSPKRVAELGTTASQYLVYQRLSDDAAHLSAKSLERYMRNSESRVKWRYRIGPGDRAEVAATLHHLAIAGIQVGVAISDLLQNKEAGQSFIALAERWHAMPAVEVI